MPGFDEGATWFVLWDRQDILASYSQKFIGDQGSFFGCHSHLRGSVLLKHFSVHKAVSSVSSIGRDAALAVSCLISTFSSVLSGDAGLASDDPMRYLVTYVICLAAVKSGAFHQPAAFSISGTFLLVPYL